jgi:acetylornithine/succinyldiaminopimelate/putrescine aminotransferase
VLPAVRGRGLALGLPCDAVSVSQRLLGRGVVAVPAGRAGDVLEISPPLTIPVAVLESALAVVAELAA